jgi:hypothetical protein
MIKYTQSTEAGLSIVSVSRLSLEVKLPSLFGMERDQHNGWMDVTNFKSKHTKKRIQNNNLSVECEVFNGGTMKMTTE